MIPVGRGVNNFRSTNRAWLCLARSFADERWLANASSVSKREINFSDGINLGAAFAAKIRLRFAHFGIRPFEGKVRDAVDAITSLSGLGTARQSFSLTPQRYQSRRGTRFPVRVMAGDPDPLVAEPGTFRRQDKLISFDPRPSERQNSTFALVSHSHS